MRPPLTYYGGKQKLAPEIVPLIPDHTLYSEPFCGGAAILFAKPPSVIEVVNDTNTELINFYKVIQEDFISLEKKVRITLHSRRLFDDAKVIYNNPHLFTPLERAWAVWTQASQSFASMLGGTFGYDKTKKASTSKKITNKRLQFTEEIAIRLQNVQIECADALYIIQSRDSDQAFHYCDPPYFNSDCGHYTGYTRDDMNRLLQLLSTVKGKFLLSSYPSDLLEQYTKQHGWHTKSFKQKVSVNKGSGRGKTKV